MRDSTDHPEGCRKHFILMTARHQHLTKIFFLCVFASLSTLETGDLMGRTSHDFELGSKSVSSFIPTGRSTPVVRGNSPYFSLTYAFWLARHLDSIPLILLILLSSKLSSLFSSLAFSESLPSRRINLIYRSRPEIT